MKLGHEVHLTAAFKDVDALLGGDDRVSVEVSRPLFEFGEIFDAFQRSLGPEQPLNIHSSQGWRVETVPEFLGTDVTHQVGGSV